MTPPHSFRLNELNYCIGCFGLRVKARFFPFTRITCRSYHTSLPFVSTVPDKLLFKLFKSIDYTFLTQYTTPRPTCQVT